jgi:hypothetical protein
MPCIVCVFLWIQGGDVVRLRHAEVEGQLAAFVPPGLPPTAPGALPKSRPAFSPSSSQVSAPSGVSLMLNPEEEDNFGSSLSLWEVWCTLPVGVFLHASHPRECFRLSWSRR